MPLGDMVCGHVEDTLIITIQDTIQCVGAHRDHNNDSKFPKFSQNLIRPYALVDVYDMATKPELILSNPLFGSLETKMKTNCSSSIDLKQPVLTPAKELTFCPTSFRFTRETNTIIPAIWDEVSRVLNETLDEISRLERYFGRDLGTERDLGIKVSRNE